MPQHANWSYPTSIWFGAGRIQELAKACETAGISRPLFVTDKGLAGLEIVENALQLLKEAGLGSACFSEVDSNPTDLNMAAGLEAFKSGGHDGIVAFGGGSALDLGKVIALMVGQSRPVWDFEDISDWWTRADADAIVPNIAVPTTAGTGSEVGRAGVLTNSAEKVKKIIFHPRLMPSVVIEDPALTIGLPEFITVGSGLDAFVHCLEAYCAPSYHPMSQGIALEGMRLAKENLPLVVKDPENLEARGHMMVAASMGATAFQKGLGAIHALSHPIGAVFNTHHGMTNAVMMPPVLRFNRPAIESLIERAAAYLGIEGGFDGFYDYVMQTRAELGVPDKITALADISGQLDLLAKMAVEDPTAGANPVKLTVEDARRLYEESL